MDDLTKIAGIGKASAKKLAEAGFATFAALAAATDAAALQKLQDAGIATVDIDRLVQAAAELAKDASLANQGGGKGAGKAASPTLIARQEIRHLGTTYGPGDELPATVEGPERTHLLKRGYAEEIG